MYTLWFITESFQWSFVSTVYFIPYDFHLDLSLSLGSAKPLLTENQSFKEQLRESTTKIQVDAIQPEERVFSELNVTSDFDKWHTRNTTCTQPHL